MRMKQKMEMMQMMAKMRLRGTLRRKMKMRTKVMKMVMMKRVKKSRMEEGAMIFEIVQMSAGSLWRKGRPGQDLQEECYIKVWELRSTEM